MSDDLVFYTNPRSRGRNAPGMREETRPDYRAQGVDYSSRM